MTKKELTIIVPCFNMDKYLNKCLDSIFSQTYQDFNVIAIDDCSKDSTYDILCSYQNKHKNMEIIKNKKNLGAGRSRNIALSMCKSEYVTFIDGDDYIGSDYYSNFITKMKKSKADIGVCDIYIKYENHEMVDTISTCCDGSLTKYNFIVNGLAASPCNKVFRLSLFNDNLFAEDIINEDIPAIITALIKAKKIVYVPNVYYNYIQHSSSVQNSSLSIKKLDIFKSMNILKERIKEYDYQDYYDGIVFNQIILLLLYIIPKESNYHKRKLFLKEYSKLVSDYNIDSNSYLDVFYSSQSIKHSTYYKLLINMVAKKHINSANILISMYKFYKKFFTEYVLIDKYDLKSITDLAKRQKHLPKKDITVIVPNYNYSKYLYQRIYSILDQDIAISKLIILDDASIDNSKEVIDKIENAIKKYVDISVVYNKKNSGSAFKQWKKGIELATTDYIWICEADDFAKKHFLKNIFNSIKDNVVMAYTDTGFMLDDGSVMQKSVVKDIDILKTHHWNSSYINNGMDELNNYAYLNCTIANVSSLVFKRIELNDIFKKMDDFKQAGDWMFYIELMQHGDVAYINQVLNYYRIHGSNATTLNNKQLQFDEIKRIHEYNIELLKLNKHKKEKIIERQNYLKEKWKVK